MTASTEDREKPVEARARGYRRIRAGFCGAARADSNLGSIRAGHPRTDDPALDVSRG